MNQIEIGSLLTLVAIIIYQLLSWNVTRLRIKFKVASPSVQGPLDFSKGYKAHLNYGENLLIFLPLLWIIIFVLNQFIAILYTLIWISGRIIWLVSYICKNKTTIYSYLGIGMTYGANVLAIIVILLSIFK
jgi:glutathione S-transferase